LESATRTFTASEVAADEIAADDGLMKTDLQKNKRNDESIVGTGDRAYKETRHKIQVPLSFWEF
jgi:hypothetical protein